MAYENNKEWWMVRRSRHGGKFWANLPETFWTLEDAKRFVESEHRDHPSDWLCVVRITETSEFEILGNKKK